MSTVTVSDKGQVVIPADIRKRLGIAPGCQLDFSLEGGTIRARIKRKVTPTSLDEGFGMLVSKRKGTARLADFDPARAMREGAPDNGKEADHDCD